MTGAIQTLDMPPQCPAQSQYHTSPCYINHLLHPHNLSREDSHHPQFVNEETEAYRGNTTWPRLCSCHADGLRSELDSVAAGHTSPNSVCLSPTEGPARSTRGHCVMSQSRSHLSSLSIGGFIQIGVPRAQRALLMKAMAKRMRTTGVPRG